MEVILIIYVWFGVAILAVTAGRIATTASVEDMQAMRTYYKSRKFSLLAWMIFIIVFNPLFFFVWISENCKAKPTSTLLKCWKSMRSEWVES